MRLTQFIREELEKELPDLKGKKDWEVHLIETNANFVLNFAEHIANRIFEATKKEIAYKSRWGIIKEEAIYDIKLEEIDYETTPLS